MATLRKDPRKKSPYWYCVLTRPDGSRTTRSTKTKKWGEAVELCQKWQRQQDTLKKTHRLENKEAVMESFIVATRKAAKGEFTEATAKQTLNQILEATGQAPMKLVNTRTFLTDWANSKAVSKAPGTAKRYQHTVETFIEHLGRKASTNIASLVAKDIESFRDLQIKEGKSAATANMVVKTLRIPLNLARRQGIILTNPAEAVDLLRNESATRETFTRKQLADLLNVADTEWKGMILLGACAGLRIGDAAKLTWADIDLQRKVIHYFPQKAYKTTKRKPVETIILPDLEEHLLSLPVKSRKTDAPLFPTLSKKTVSGDHGLSLIFGRLINKAGINREAVSDKVKGKGRRFFSLGFHSLRHNFISTMANIGVSKELRMKLAGHSSNVH